MRKRRNSHRSRSQGLSLRTVPIQRSSTLDRRNQNGTHNTQLIPYSPWRVILYKRPAGQVVLYNQENSGVEVRHIVPHGFGTPDIQEQASVDERRVVNSIRNASGSNHGGSLKPLERKSSICPTCLRPLSRYPEGSWEPHAVEESYSDPNNTVTTDREYFTLLARYLELHQSQLSLEDTTSNVKSDLSDRYYAGRLQSLPDISHFQLGGEGSHALEDVNEDHERAATSSEISVDVHDESDNENTMLISPGTDGSTSEPRTIDDGKSTPTGGGVSAKSFNQGYYERFFTEQNKLGKGLRGSVFSCQHVLDGVFLGHYAVKKVAVGNNHVWLKRMLREVKLLESLRHPNVVEYKHSWLEMHSLTNFGPRVPCLFILMEYANGGNLQEYMEPKSSSADVDASDVSLKQKILNRRKQRRRHIAETSPSALDPSAGSSDKGPMFLSVDQIWSFFSDICNGLAHLHQLQIIHRDLKHMNLLLHWNDPANKETSGETPRLMLTDFGECEVLSHLEKRDRTGATGTLEFMAPELIEVDNTGRYLDSYSTKADMWSLGMVLYYLCYSTLPYVDIDDLDVLRRDILGLKHIDFARIRRPPSAEDIPSELQGIMQQLLNYDESKRPDISDIIKQVAKKRSLWHSRRYDASRFEIRDSDVATNGTNTPGTMTPRLSSASRVDSNRHKHFLRPVDDGDFSEFPVVLLSGREADGGEGTHAEPRRNVLLPNVLRRHSAGLVSSDRRDSGLAANNEGKGINGNGKTAADDTTEPDAGYDNDDDDIADTTGSKRHLDLSSSGGGVSNADAYATRHKRPRYTQSTGLGSSQASSAFIVKTAVMLVKMYFLQTLDVQCDEQKVNLRYMMGVSLVLSAFDIHHSAMRVTLALLAANVCILALWKLYYLYLC